MEQLFDLYSSTLASGYTAGSGTASVTSASGLPSTGDYTLTVLDQTSKAVKVIFHVTARSGTTLTVTAEGADVNAASGDIILGYDLTTRSLVAVHKDWAGVGATSSLPSTAGRKTGQRYKATDGNFEYIFDEGSGLWIPYFRGMKTTLPDNSTFSWINQTSAAVTVEADGSILLQGTANGGVNMQIRVFTAPATPYKYRFILTPMLNISSNSRCGVLFSDGTKHSDVDLTAAANVFQFEGVNMTNSTTVSASFNFTSVPTVPSAPSSNQPIILGLADDGANRIYYWYPDGYTEITLFSVARTTFLTATKLGFFVDDNVSNKGTSCILHGVDRLI